MKMSTYAEECERVAKMLNVSPDIHEEEFYGGTSEYRLKGEGC